MATFADMATLLMSFFVLLLAFSEMDVVKYKAISGSMKMALGVKADSHEITMPEGKDAEVNELRGEELPSDEPEGDMEESEEENLSKDALLVRDKLAAEIRKKKVELETMPDRIIIRLPEQGLFGSGSATLDKSYIPILRKIREVLAQTEGSIVVAGHTDDRPIATSRFPSNWELSASRSGAVVRVLLKEDGIEHKRIVAQGYADTRPLTPNVDTSSRAKNRRVDIILATRKTAEDVDKEGVEGEGETEGEGEGEGGE